MESSRTKRHGTTAVIAAGLAVCLVVGASSAQASKDQSRIEAETDQAPYSGPRTPGLKFDPGTTAPEPDPDANADELPQHDTDLGKMPEMITIELTEDLARHALDALSDIGDKYDERGLAEYETLEEFVAKTEAGKELDADVRRFGFANVTEWNAALLSIEFAYGAMISDQETDIQAQIDEAERDEGLTDKERQVLIASLKAMLSTPQNKKVVRALMKDANYAEQLKQFEVVE
jgi:hypothetical protein